MYLLAVKYRTYAVNPTVLDSPSLIIKAKLPFPTSYSSSSKPSDISSLARRFEPTLIYLIALSREVMSPNSWLVSVLATYK